MSIAHSTTLFARSFLVDCAIDLLRQAPFAA